MDYKRYDVKEEPEKLQMLLNAYKINGPKMGKILGCCYVTGKRRVDFPGELTVDELRKLMKHIPRDEVLGAL